MASKFIKKCVSTYQSISKGDLVNGLVVSVLTAVVAVIGQTLEYGHFPSKVEWILAGKAGFGAGAGYLIKKFFSGPDAQKQATDGTCDAGFP